jgi:hypothetical protein
VYVSVCVCECVLMCLCRSQWPRGLRRRSATARLLRSWVRLPVLSRSAIERKMCVYVCVCVWHWSESDVKIYFYLFSFLARDSTLSIPNKITLYKLFIRSVLTYAAPVWSRTSSSNYCRLQILQSKCLRIIGNYPSTPPSHVFIPP